MKKFRKLLSLVLAMVMVLAMAAPSFAASGTNSTKGSITIAGALEGKEYTLYKIFDLESYDTDKGVYSYKVVTEWKPFIAIYDEFTLDNNGYLIDSKEMDAATAEAFAQAALQYATENSVQAIGSYSNESTDGNVAVKPDEEDTGKYKIVISELDLGYYLVDSSAGTLCSLDTTTPNVEIDEKNEIPEIEKKINDNASNSASIGDTIPFEITIKAKAGAEEYVLHDTMSAGLTLNQDSFEVRLGAEELEESDSTYQIVTNSEELDDTCTFEIVFVQSFCDSLTDSSVITITYSAFLNADAATGNTDPETNKAILDYGNGYTVETDDTETKTYTYEFDLVKTDTNDKILQNATFKLYKDESATQEIQLVFDAGRNAYRPVIDGLDTPENVTVITAGDVVVAGLASGTYYLKEETAPDGYNKLDSVVPVNIVNDNLKKPESGTGFGNAIQVENNTGALLPSTGGIGTTIFYTAGIILMAGAVFFVVRRKRA